MNTEDHWKKFLRRIDHARQKLGCPRPKPGSSASNSEDAWFRGLTKTSHQLMPSLFRCFASPNDDRKRGTWRKVREVECDLFYEFSARAREVHGPEMSDWDILFAMQHYGTPTRLLDWTEALSVAVFFACEDVANDAAENPCVWVMNPFQLNRLSWGKKADLLAPRNLGWEKDKQHPDGGVFWEYGEIVQEVYDFGWDYPVAIYPRQQTNRMHAQKAWFTIHGDEHIPLEEMPGAKRALERVELPVEALTAAREFLDDAGIHTYSIFPDLVNLSKYLKQKYGLMPTAAGTGAAKRRHERSPARRNPIQFRRRN